MAEVTVRTIAAAERDAVLDLLDGWLPRAFFARYFAFDPTFRDELCFVAEHDGRLVSTLQVFRKTVRAAAGAVLEVGCVGNVYTDPAWRGSGVAGRLLEQAIAAMHAHRFDASLLFATRLDFYARFGWRSLPRVLSFIARGDTAGGGVAEPFAPDRDLDQVMAIYDEYNGAPGAVRRDPAYWRGQLRYAGNPDERFVVARRGGTVLAYARSAALYDLHVVIEHGCRGGETEALADLIADQHHAAGAHPGTLAQLVPDAALDAALRARGLEARAGEDRSWMWRPIVAEQLAARLGVPAAAVHAEDFFAGLFPADASRYWMSDRF